MASLVDSPLTPRGHQPRCAHSIRSRPGISTRPGHAQQQTDMAEPRPLQASSSGGRRRRRRRLADQLCREPKCGVGLARSLAQDRAAVAGSGCTRPRAELDRSALRAIGDALERGPLAGGGSRRVRSRYPGTGELRVSCDSARRDVLWCQSGATDGGPTAGVRVPVPNEKQRPLRADRGDDFPADGPATPPSGDGRCGFHSDSETIDVSPWPWSKAGRGFVDSRLGHVANAAPGYGDSWG